MQMPQAGPSEFVSPSMEDPGGNAIADGALLGPGADPTAEDSGPTHESAAAADHAAAAAGVGCLTPAQGACS